MIFSCTCMLLPMWVADESVTEDDDGGHAAFVSGHVAPSLSVKPDN